MSEGKTQREELPKIRQREGSLGQRRRWAESKGAFEEKVKPHLEGLDCVLVELEEVQLLECRMKTPDFPEELIDMRETANRQPSDTAFGTFHDWHQEDAN